MVDASKHQIDTPEYRFIAPELIIPDNADDSFPFTTFSDVWAFGMTIIEVLQQTFFPFLLSHCMAQILTDEKPFHREKFDAHVLERVLRGERPGKPEPLPVEKWKEVKKCWYETPSERPTMDFFCKLFQD